MYLVMQLNISLSMRATHLWGEWRAVQSVHREDASPVADQHGLQRQVPRHGWLKCNVYPGFHRAAGPSSWGWCA
jgi:hypothetical protein